MSDLYKEACDIVCEHEHKKRKNINECYKSLSLLIQREIRNAAKEGKRFLSIDPGRSNITIWDSIPKLLHDPVFKGFVITPEHPDEDDTYIIIEWRAT